MTRKCHLCDNHADPRMNIGVHDGAFPLCDGCSPNEDETHIQAVSDRCRAAGPPRTDYTPSVGFNDTRLPHKDPSGPGLVAGVTASIDWSTFDKFSESICGCSCGAQFLSHSKFTILPAPGIVSRKPCPSCGSHSPFSSRTDWEEQVLEKDPEEEP